MTLQARIETMAVRIRQEFDATNARIGNLALLATPHKESLVAAINDVRVMQSTGVTISTDPGNALVVGTDGGLHCPAVITSTLHW
jgi:hypothetical protein